MKLLLHRCFWVVVVPSALLAFYRKVLESRTIDDISFRKELLRTGSRLSFWNNLCDGGFYFEWIRAEDMIYDDEETPETPMLFSCSYQPDQSNQMWEKTIRFSKRDNMLTREEDVFNCISQLETEMEICRLNAVDGQSIGRQLQDSKFYLNVQEWRSIVRYDVPNLPWHLKWKNRIWDAMTYYHQFYFSFQTQEAAIKQHQGQSDIPWLYNLLEPTIQYLFQLLVRRHATVTKSDDNNDAILWMYENCLAEVDAANFLYVFTQSGQSQPSLYSVTHSC